MTDDAQKRLADMLVRCGIERGVLGRIDADNVARILLPVVRELQAEELEAAAAWSTSVPSHMLRARAAALRGEAGR